MVAIRLLSNVCRWVGVPAALGLTACQQRPADVDGHKVKKTEIVNGVRVNVLEPNDKDREVMRKEANDMKKSANGVTFTPAEQQGGK
jgi:hypothetical protein